MLSGAFDPPAALGMTWSRLGLRLAQERTPILL